MYKPTTEELDFMIRIIEEDKPEMVRTLSKEALEWFVAVLRLGNSVLRAEEEEVQCNEDHDLPHQ